MTNVLVVDDEKNVLTTLAIGLKRFGYNVYKAEGGPDALRILDSNLCQIMVSDIRMEPMDGYTLAERVRELHPQVRIVLMSAYGMDDEQYKTVERLSCSRLTKPFSIRELVKVIQMEEKKGEKGCISVLGNASERRKIRHVVEESGYLMNGLDLENDIERQVKSEPCDLFIVDGEAINETNYQLLNIIDRCAPQIHVLLLAQKGGERTISNFTESNLTIVDKDLFCKDVKWAGEALDKLICTGEKTP